MDIEDQILKTFISDHGVYPQEIDSREGYVNINDLSELEKQVREDERKKIRDLLLQDIEDLGLIWGDGTGKDDEMVQSSKAFGWQLVLRVFDRIKAKYNN